MAQFLHSACSDVLIIYYVVWKKNSGEGCPGGVVRGGLSGSLRGCPRGCPGCVVLPAHAHAIIIHIIKSMAQPAGQAQLEMSHLFHPSLSVRSSSFVPPFRSRSRTLLYRSFHNSCADWSPVAVEAKLWPRDQRSETSSSFGGGAASFA